MRVVTIATGLTNKLAGVACHPHLTAKFITKRMVAYARRPFDRISTKCSTIFWSIYSKIEGKGISPQIKYLASYSLTAVDSFWGEHTVLDSGSDPYKNAYQARRLSKRHLEWRSSKYPLFTEFMKLYGNHDGQVVLDYGCGVGSDLVGFMVYGNAKKVIGIDVSDKALNLARQRLTVHKIDPTRVDLICTADSNDILPIDDSSIDYIHCAGVLHHTSRPGVILSEFHRILGKNSQACVMVYNYNSIFLHLYVAYELMILQERFVGLDIYDTFAKSTDTEGCPISRCYRSEQFITLCETAGFNAEYEGGYLSQFELKCLKDYGFSALNDERLDDEHRSFIGKLYVDERGFPKYEGKHAGIGGVYSLRKKRGKKVK